MPANTSALPSSRTRTQYSTCLYRRLSPFHVSLSSLPLIPPFRQLSPHHGGHLKMHNLMIPNLQLYRAEPILPPELLNLFDD